MRWWLRIVLTLILAPLVWQLAAIYLGAAQNGDPTDMIRTSLAGLPKLYLSYTLPALAAVVLLLVPADLLLKRLGADLLIVVVAPLLAVLVPVVLSHVVADPRLDAAGLDALALVYGLVFGLTVREPRPRTVEAQHDPDPTTVGPLG